ncbi:LysM peptidoglycan-binding domain-containing protein, partial [Chloroflexota bacterium]
TITPEAVSLLPAVIASALPPTPVHTPEPTLVLRPYEVGLGETLSEIAQIFGISVEQLMEINNLNNPDEIRTGMILDVPMSGTTAQEPGIPTQENSEITLEPVPTSTPPPIPEDSKIKIVTIVGVDDLATEHLQIQSISSEALSLDGWRLETNDGSTIHPDFGALHLIIGHPLR